MFLGTPNKIERRVEEDCDAVTSAYEVILSG